MTSTQLAAIAYRLGAIDIIATQIYQLTLELEDLQEGSLSVKLKLTLRAFDERASEHRSILDQYANEITTDTAPIGQGGQTTSHEQENL